MHKVIGFLLICIIGALAGCTATDPMIDDIYTQSIFPGDNVTYDVGSPTLTFDEGYFNNLYVGGGAVTAGPGGAHTLDGGQLDVTIVAVGDNEVLAYDLGTLTWINQTAAEAGLADTTHAVTHTDGTDDIQDATAAQKGLMTIAYAGKLDGIEALADVTDAANVDLAGAVMNTDFNAKGDLLTATADDTPSIQGVGADGTVLTADSAEADGIKWAVPASGMSGYTELDGSVVTTAAGQGAGDGEWIDWDLSGTLPAGTVAVDILIQKLIATDDVGVRKDGSGLIRITNTLKLQALTVTSEVGASRIIEIMSADVSDADTFAVMGYWD